MSDETNIVPFVPLAEQPHEQALLGCGACGHLWVGVWPSSTSVNTLQCPRCHVAGCAQVDPPRTMPAEPIDVDALIARADAAEQQRDHAINISNMAVAARREAEQQRDTARALLSELVAVVRGECPSLLDEDSGGDAELDLRIDAALSAPEGR